MSEFSIQAEKLSKTYRIHHASAWGRRSASGATLSELVHGAVSSLFKREKEIAAERANDEEFHALRDVSFEIKEGEAVGIIGRNGAGKSTLLKILSKITEPSAGHAIVRGRVASLLEVGSGFHPELTGRENIFLNGSILGMTRVEILSKLDEIVEFSGVGKFLDTPVKRYSSGMYVRLAFAVAAHLEPEILVVDEVLAVGDIEFQRKCLGKMEGVAKGGRTVIFVSHSMAAIRNLTTRCLVLDQGRSIFMGDTSNAVEIYMGCQAQNVDGGLEVFRPAWAKPLITSASLTTSDGRACSVIGLGDGFGVDMSFSSEVPLKRPNMGIVIQHPFHGVIANINMWITGDLPDAGAWTKGVMRCFIPQLPLIQGNYTIDVWLADETIDMDSIQGYLRLQIEEADVYESGRAPNSNLGIVLLTPCWTIE